MTIVALTPIASSNILAAGYDGSSKTLAIQFHSGALHHFLDVPYDLYRDFSNADSHGKFFNAEIKGLFDSVRVDGQGEPI